MQSLYKFLIYFFFCYLDDLFGDSTGTVKGKKGKTSESTQSSNSQYLDQNWELSSEDQKEFKGFNKKNPVIDIIDNEDEEVAYPCFALTYRLRKEFVDTSIDSVLADHNEYCKKFKRLMNSEVITMKQRKGFVLLWVGLSATDKTETKTEITEFLEDDPLILKDMVEKWDLIDLEEKANGTKAITADSNKSVSVNKVVV